MLSVLFYSHLLAIAKEQIHFIFILLFYTWSTNRFHLANQINHVSNTLFIIWTESHEMIYPVSDREDKNNTLQSIVTSLYSP